MKTDSDLRIAEKILQFAELRGKRVLEIGCGNGRITSLLVGTPEALIGIDPDIDKIKEARETVAGADFRIGSGERLNYSDASFDVVLFILSLHHQNSSVAIREAARVLRDDGVILVVEPVHDGEVERLFALLCNESRATINAQQAIDECDLRLERSEAFTAKWFFEHRKDVIQSLFEYYDMPFDNRTAEKISGFLGAQRDKRPIVLVDTMTIQALKKPIFC